MNNDGELAIDIAEGDDMEDMLLSEMEAKGAHQILTLVGIHFCVGLFERCRGVCVCVCVCVCVLD